MKRIFLIAIGLLDFYISLFSQVFDFRNQKLSDICLGLGEIYSAKVIVDNTLDEKVNYHFEGISIDDAFSDLSRKYEIFVNKENNEYIVSKIEFIKKAENKFNLVCSDLDIEILLKQLSKLCRITILYDSFPELRISLRLEDVVIEDILNFILVKLPGFSLERMSGGYYLSKTSGTNNLKRNTDVFSISKDGELFDCTVAHASFISVIDSLFKKAEKEYLLTGKFNFQIENVKLCNKSFESLFRSLLDYCSLDYYIEESGIFYVYEISKKDLLKKFKETKIIRLQNISTDRLMAILPSELNSSSFYKVDKISNTIILNGSREEVGPIEEFIKKADEFDGLKKFYRFELKYLSVGEAAELIPENIIAKERFKSEMIILPDSNWFVMRLEEDEAERLKQFIEEIDVKKPDYCICVKFIKTEDLLTKLPAVFNKEKIFIDKAADKIFFYGSEKEFQDLKNYIEQIDIPVKQIRYQILVVQKQKNDGVNWNSSISEASVQKSEADISNGIISHSGVFSNLFNVNFDVISNFGVQFAAKMNGELSSGKSKILADTTLNGISGETINFSNTNTFRYRDIITNAEGELYTSTTREIASGLSLSINGWVSGNDVISVKIDTVVSKQGSSDSSADTNNPPATSEKKVTTHVRAKSGECVVIGGLFQQEVDSTEKRIPVLGAIPLVGNLFKTKTVSMADTEFVIYLIPFVERDNFILEKELVDENAEKQLIERLYKKFVVNQEVR